MIYAEHELKMGQNSVKWQILVLEPQRRVIRPHVSYVTSSTIYFKTIYNVKSSNDSLLGHSNIRKKSREFSNVTKIASKCNAIKNF